MWLVLGLSLITAWSAHAWHSRARQSDKLLPSRPLQFTALLLLVILLFPIISVTDDIAMYTAPRDAERALRLHDSFDGSQPAPALPISITSWMYDAAALLGTGSNQPVEPDANLIVQLAGTKLPVDSRPPPIAL